MSNTWEHCSKAKLKIINKEVCYEVFHNQIKYTNFYLEDTRVELVLTPIFHDYRDV